MTVVWVLVLVAAGCVRTKFTPLATGQGQLPPVAREAVLAQVGDVDTLAAVGGRVVGTMDAAGGAYASKGRVQSETLSGAARHGATHVIIAASMTEVVKLTSDRATTTCSGDTCDTTFREGVTAKKRSMASVLVRVEPERWIELPPALRPEPLDRVKAQLEQDMRERRATEQVALDAEAAAALGMSGTLELATDIGFTLGSSPEQFGAACRAFAGGEVQQWTWSNDAHQMCRLPSRPLPTISGTYCYPEGRNGAARLCVLVEKQEGLSRAEATELSEKLRRHLKSRLGPAQASGLTTRWVYQGATVELLAMQKAEEFSVTVRHATPDGSAALQRQPPGFPKQVAGFAFGDSEQEVRDTCERAGGLFVAPREVARAGPTIAPTFQCHGPRVDLPLKVEVVFGFLCEGTVCEVALKLQGPVNHALAALESKYGIPFEHANAAPQCKKGARHLWLWTEGTSAVGTIRLTDDCAIAVFYDDARGVQLRDRQYRERQENY